MRPVEGTFTWGYKQQRAARKVAGDRMTDREIAYRCGVNKATLERWKLLPEFMARVGEIRAAMAAAELAGGIADRQRRVVAINTRHQLAEQVIEERAADPQMRAVPGGTTGLLVRQQKMLGVGKNARLVEEFSVDTGLLAALAALEKQVAQELGQWTEKRELTGKDGGPVHVDLTGFSDDELAVLERARRKIDAAGALDTDPGADPGGAGPPPSGA